eukprot:TRINITY_DN445_c0_g3_i1.p1 TRINITY_DN445_c0_g3~~TRINITY_DN445_c0_g3_i1.p1  ORF type:complete len:116 (-),score=24.59 TRINITY_DN445_c0_g3_i1:196-543(-)
MLGTGTFSYKNNKTNTYQHTDANGVTTTFAIVPINTVVANLQFLVAPGGAQVNVPAGWSLSDSAGAVPAFGAPSSFFIGWVESYVLRDATGEVLQVSNQKQQSIRKLNNANVQAV